MLYEISHHFWLILVSLWLGGRLSRLQHSLHAMLMTLQVTILHAIFILTRSFWLQFFFFKNLCSFGKNLLAVIIVCISFSLHSVGSFRNFCLNHHSCTHSVKSYLDLYSVFYFKRIPIEQLYAMLPSFYHEDESSTDPPAMPPANWVGDAFSGRWPVW